MDEEGLITPVMGAAGGSIRCLQKFANPSENIRLTGFWDKTYFFLNPLFAMDVWLLFFGLLCNPMDSWTGDDERRRRNSLHHIPLFNYKSIISYCLFLFIFLFIVIVLCSFYIVIFSLKYACKHSHMMYYGSVCVCMFNVDMISQDATQLSEAVTRWIMFVLIHIYLCLYGYFSIFYGVVFMFCFIRNRVETLV